MREARASTGRSISASKLQKFALKSANLAPLKNYKYSPSPSNPSFFFILVVCLDPLLLRDVMLDLIIDLPLDIC